MSENVNKKVLDGIMTAMPDKLNAHEMAALTCTILEVYGMGEEWPRISEEVTHMLVHFEAMRTTVN